MNQAQTVRITARAGKKAWVQPGSSVRIGSLVNGIRLPARSSPAAQPAIRPTVSAIARTRGYTCAFSDGNWLA